MDETEVMLTVDVVLMLEDNATLDRDVPFSISPILTPGDKPNATILKGNIDLILVESLKNVSRTHWILMCL